MIDRQERIEYTLEDYKYVDSLIEQYQSGENQDEAIDELIKLFKPYLNKFFNIIRKGQLNLKDYDSRMFISMFIDDSNIRRDLARNRQPSSVQHEAHMKAEWLADAFKRTDNEDIMQDLKTVLITQANRFTKKKKRVGFVGYLNNSFRFELRRVLDSHTRDPLTYSSTRIISYNDTENIDNGSNFADTPYFMEDEYLAIMDEELDINWIYGSTCHPVFKNLAPLDRLILRMSHLENMSDVEISRKTGFHVNTIRKRKKKAIKDIEKKMEELYLTNTSI